MKMQKRQFRIGELAKTLEVEQFVIRFWEKEFDVTSSRSNGGQRFYTEKDLFRFQTIKQLLYEKGFTIAGAKKQLLSYSSTKLLSKNKEAFLPASQEKTFNKIHEKKNEFQMKVQSKLKVIHKKLLELKNII